MAQLPTNRPEGHYLTDQEIARQNGHGGGLTKPKGMHPRCAANGCYLGDRSAHNILKKAVDGKLITSDKQTSIAYSLCRVTAGGECRCQGAGREPCPPMLDLVGFVSTALIPAVLAAHGVTDADLRMQR